MSEIQRLIVEDEDGNQHTIYVESKSQPSIPEPARQGGGLQSYGGTADAVLKMEEAQQIIRLYAKCVLTSFKNFSIAEIEEVNIKFGLKLGAKGGIPFITEGSAESNLEISLKCKFPDKQAGGQS
jgi:hypothetical protein